MFLHHKHSWICLLFSFFVNINMAINFPRVPLTISIGVTHTDVETHLKQWSLVWQSSPL